MGKGCACLIWDPRGAQFVLLDAMIMAEEQKPDRQQEEQEEEEEDDEQQQQQQQEQERKQEEEDKEKSPQSPPSKVARVSSGESRAAEAGAVTTAAGEEGKPRGFTFMQMQESHHQALIFHHMVAAIPVPVPVHLILPVWKSVAASYGPHHYPSLGMGNLCSDFGNSMEPEPGRCRRTDGKKWRCSSDVVPDQKYCERRMHRGRNRSRKPVEAPTATTVVAATSSSLAPSTTTTTTNNYSSSNNINMSSSSNDASTARIIRSSPASVLSSSTACKTAAS